MRIKHIRQTLLNASFLLATISLFCHKDSRAQSFIPTGPLINPGYQFAALTGYHGAWQVNGVYRNQWPGIPINYQTIVGGTDFYIDEVNSGVGVSYFNESSANGILSTQEVRLSVAPRFQVSENLSFMTGLAYGYGQNQIDWGKAITADEIDPNTGQITNTQTGRQNVAIHRLAPSAGFLAFNRLLVVYQFTTGLGLNESFLQGGESVFPTLHHAYLSYRISFTEDIHLTPSIRYASQGAFRNRSVGLNSYIKGVLVGAGYRFSDAVFFQAGYRLLDRFMLTYSYDMTVSSLGTQTLGSHEIGFRATLFKGKAKNVLIENLQLL